VDKLKTPITYYGGKQSMLREILPIIPEHRIYVEPFFGGGAVFWAKEPTRCEVINDVNGNIVNFYEVLKHDFFKLRERIESTPHSRDVYKKAFIIYEMPWLFADDRVIRAWAFWVCTNQGFASKIGTWGYDRDKRAMSIANKVEAFKEVLSDRLRHTQIENNDACKVIQSRDAEDAFTYADPPYINTDQGHYGGYTEQHYRKLLDTLASIKGKFLLSNFPSDILDEYVKKFNWHLIAIKKQLSASNGATADRSKKKVEVLVSNYPIG
jgi:DNA adenine methylase